MPEEAEREVLLTETLSDIKEQLEDLKIEKELIEIKKKTLKAEELSEKITKG